MSLAASSNVLPTIDARRAPGRHRQKPAWWQGWELLAAEGIAILLLLRDHRAWVQMWTWTLAIFAGCKWLTWRRRTVREASAWRHAAYLFGWVGMDADAFLTQTARPSVVRPRIEEWAFAAAKLLFGLLLLSAAFTATTDRSLIVGWIAMAGLVFTLHFGIGHLLSCFWRHCGFDARPLMLWPIAASSLSDFWGRRWNTAFHDLTTQFAFRPFLKSFGARGALMMAFLFSGLLHDAVISLSAGSGYGRPTLYFLLQGVGVLLERRILGRDAVQRGSFLSRLYAATFVLAPAGLLFHPPFVTRVVVPFVQQLGAWL